jgi:hypothetical protein
MLMLTSDASTEMWRIIRRAPCIERSIRKSNDHPTPADFSILDSRIPYGCTPPGTNCNDSSQRHIRDVQFINTFHDAFNNYLDDHQGNVQSESLLAKYVRDPVAALSVDKSLPANLAPDVNLIERRLSLLYNTPLESQLGISIGHDPKCHCLIRTRPWDATFLSGTQSFSQKGNLMSTKLTFVVPTLNYALHGPLGTIYFLSVAIMFDAAIFPVVMHYYCNAPPILGFVSSLVRDSKNFENIQVICKGDVQGISSEDRPVRTKQIGAVRIQVADVRANESVGRIAFAPARPGLRMRKGRIYEYNGNYKYTTQARSSTYDHMTLKTGSLVRSVKCR